MQKDMNQIVRSMLDRETLEDVPRDELRQLTNEFPYSPLLQFLYSRKLKISGDAGFGDSVARTALFFTNPHWLHQQLVKKTDSERVAEMERSLEEVHASPAVTDPETDASAAFAQLMEEGQPSAETLEEEASPAAIEPARQDEDIIDDDQVFEAATEEEVMPDGETGAFEDDGETRWDPAEAADDTEEMLTGALTLSEAEEELAEALSSDEEPGTDELTTGTEYTNLTGEGGIIEVAGPETDDTQTEVEFTSEPQSGTETEDQVSRIYTETPVETAEPQEVDSEDDTAERIPDEAPETGTETPVLSGTFAESLRALAEGLQQPLPEDIEADQEPIFEPAMKVDYFASQGIRAEDDTRDLFGKKLRSFTEWLRTMKRIQPDRHTIELDERAEERIKQNAEQSNEKPEVLTEAMAEVYVKQGLQDKAIDLYEKLSLIYPGKSAIFAAKISELKGDPT